MAFDISPFFRSTVGFDRLFDQLENNWAYENSWPQYDVLRTGDDDYRIMIAVPGYRQEDLSLESKEGLLTVKGTRSVDAEDNQYIHRGIGKENFTRTFQLAEFVKVNGATLKDGVLSIELHREVPESMKPRQIEIEVDQQSQPRTIESSQKKVEETKAA
ncbi:MAG: Hsp20 family protein [Pseudomonadales bacterium]|nr:Hsp20 family protein [Pseudomonadales bacterium]